MKKLFMFLVILAIFTIPSVALAVHDSGYVLNITRDDMIINEVDNQVSLPFNQEYKVLLRNTTSHGCTVRLFIDNILVSNMGDFILRAGEELNLERFVDNSLQEGQSFLFVPVEDERVDDPTREENGIIRAEFYPEDIPKNEGSIIIDPQQFQEMYPYWKFDNSTLESYSIDSMNSLSANISCCSVSTSAGATVEGNVSYQKFSEGHIEVKKDSIILELKIVGINR